MAVAIATPSTASVFFLTLLRGPGLWKESVFLAGGLAPGYLVAARPPKGPAHAGTLDVDIAIDLQILADTAGYCTLEENLRAMRVERSPALLSGLT